MSSFDEILNDAIGRGGLLKAVLSRPRRAAERPARKVVVRPIRVQGEPAYQFAVRSGNCETHENVPPEFAADRILGWCEGTFSDCHLFTPDAEFSIRVSRDGKTRIKRSVVSRRSDVEVEHDRTKPYLIPDGVPCPFLIETGVMTAAGKVRAAKYHKFRQINRFLELVNDVVPALPESGRLNVVDFGSGKSFLTFAVHHLLTVVHRRDVAIAGLDRNADVVEKCANLAAKLDLRGLSFRRQEISEFEGFPDAGRVDLVVSLHACDTATDDALAQAVRWNAGVIFAVPCCQHEIAGRISGNQLRAVTRHGILKERLAAIATDALRAEILEACGYRTQVVEFIDLEHTAKNVLIRAVRRQKDAAESDRSQNIQQLKQMLGISRFHLEDVLADRGE
jgi:SAM-dependent methyltransferase